MKKTLLAMLALAAISANALAQSALGGNEDEEYLFYEWVNNQKGDMTSVPGEAVTTTSGAELVVENGEINGHSLNGRFAFKSGLTFNQNRTQVRIVTESRDEVLFSILNLKEGDMVSIQSVTDVAGQYFYIASGNAKYKDAEGYAVETKIDEDLSQPSTENIIPSEFGDDGKAVITTTNYVMTADGSLDLSKINKKLNLSIRSIRISHPRTMTIGATGYATFSSDKAIDFGWQEGFKAYIAPASSLQNGVLTMQEITDGIIPANTGVVLYGQSGTYYNCGTDKTAPEDNLLSVVATDETQVKPTNAGYVNYLLAEYNGEVGFWRFDNYRYNMGGKAYLHVPTGTQSEAKGIVLSLDGVATGISGVEADGVEDNGAEKVYYDLSGRRVENPTRGLYIVNGKKVIIK